MKIMTILGTRPEGIKLSPIIQLLQREPGVQSVVVNTGQHQEMLDNVLTLFGIVPDYNLSLMQKGQSLEVLSSKIIYELGMIIKKESPDVVLVQGDTTTAFCGAYVSFLNRIFIGHVEAGLRTNNKLSPYPEEINRQLIGRLADVHFACTEGNRSNLLKENTNTEHIVVVGNTVIDALYDIVSREFFPPENVKDLFSIQGRIFLVTTHRRENLELLSNVYSAINMLIDSVEDLHIIFPVHKNPQVRDQVMKHLKKSNRIHITEPLEYDVFCHLMKKSYLILTDSGGIQEESCALGVPVLLTRANTERPEGVGNSIRIVGTSTDAIFEVASELLTNESEHTRMGEAKNPFGDGKASQRIIDFLKEKFI